MDHRVFYTVVVPTLVTEATFIGITTLGDEANFVNKLVKIKRSTGELMFNVISMMLVCEECKRAGKEADCNHMMGEIPYWQDPQRHKDIEKMMEGEYETFMRETKGMNVNGLIQPVYPTTAIDNFMTNIYKEEKTHSHVFISVDPAGGGDASKYAIVSCVYDGYKMVVCFFCSTGFRLLPRFRLGSIDMSRQRSLTTGSARWVSASSARDKKSSMPRAPRFHREQTSLSCSCCHGSSGMMPGSTAAKQSESTSFLATGMSSKIIRSMAHSGCSSLNLSMKTIARMNASSTLNILSPRLLVPKQET